MRFLLGFCVEQLYFRGCGRRAFMAGQISHEDYSSAFVTCPNADVAKKLARFVCSV